MVANPLRELAHRRQAVADAKFTELVARVLDGQQLALVDVGAAETIQPRWKRITPLLDYVGFEPDPRSHAELLENPPACHSFTIHQTALARQAGEIDIFLCRKPTVSSALRPNIPWLSRFPDVERFEVMSTESVAATDLDSLRINAIDFMKLDVQGYELEILNGAEGSLSKVLGMEIEIWFQPNYVGAPMFGDIQKYLAERDFDFIDFCSLTRWERHEHNEYGQLIWGDSLFLRSPEWICANLADEGVYRRYAAICALYNRFDLVVSLVRQSGWQPDDGWKAAFEALRDNFSKVRKNSMRSARVMNQIDHTSATHLLG